MATEHRATARAVELEALLLADASGLDFLQILRRIENANLDDPRIGQAARPSDESIRFGQEPELGFPPSSLSTFQPALPSAGRPARLFARIFGLLGPSGPMPLHLSEYAWERQRHANDPTFARFLDMFNHRLLSLFYRIWAEANPVVQRDRPAEDRFAAQVASLVGMGQATLRSRMAVPDLSLLHHAGRFTPHVRNAEGLAALVENQFGVKAHVQTFVGTWIEIPTEVRWRLGRGLGAERLGLTTNLGASVWSVQSKFRLVLGPLDEEQFGHLLPGGPTLFRLRDLVRAYAGPTLSWDLKLVLDRGIERPARLGVSRLGWTGWLGRRSSAAGKQDVVIDPDAVAARPREEHWKS